MGDREKDVIRRWFDEVWNQRRDAAIDELLDPKATAFGLLDDDPTTDTPELFRRFQRSFLEMFPDLTVRVAQMISEGSQVATRLECEGHYAAALANAKPVTFGVMVFTTVRNGQIAQGWNLVDEAAMKKGIEAASGAGAAPVAAT